VGTLIFKAHASEGSVGLVIPTVPKFVGTAEYVLDLAHVTQVNHLIVCVLHNHFDHAHHLQLFKDQLLLPDGRAILVADSGGAIDHRASGAKKYQERVSPAAGLSCSFFDGEVSVDLRFVSQGKKRKGHASHLGSGRSCSATKPHCGAELVPSPDDTHCLFADLRVGSQTFNVFVNDAASAYVADALPADLCAPRRRCDLASIAIPDAHLAWGYPANLLAKLDPRAVRWVHWEEFMFRPRNARRRIDEPTRPLRTPGQLALPLRVVEEAAGVGVPSCFVQHGGIEYFG